MATPTHEIDYSQYVSIRNALQMLGIPVHRKGYRQLALAVAIFATDNTQSLTKEIYPAVAKLTGIVDWRLVERDIRTVIQHAWTNRNSAVWRIYFRDLKKAPSNKVFISVLAELLK